MAVVMENCLNELKVYAAPVKATKATGNGLNLAKSKAFRDLITSLMTQQVELTAEHVAEAKLAQVADVQFMRVIEPELDKIIYSKATTIAGYVKTFYDVGKAKGFSDMAVRQFTSNADTHAMYTLSNYNFGLVKNLSNDLREGIRREVWEGVARGEGITTIADKLLDHPLDNLQVSNRLIPASVRADMIAKTESVRAANQGLIMSFTQYGVTKVDVFNGPDPCDDCKEYAENGPYDIDNIPDGGPPFHPNCEDTLLPASDPQSKPSDPASYFDVITGEDVNVPTGLVIS